MIDFKGLHFPKEAILYALFFYLRYPGSYRDLEEIMEERGVDVDNGMLNRWVVKFAPLRHKHNLARSKRLSLGACPLGPLLRNALPGNRRNLHQG